MPEHLTDPEEGAGVGGAELSDELVKMTETAPEAAVETEAAKSYLERGTESTMNVIRDFITIPEQGRYGSWKDLAANLGLKAMTVMFAAVSVKYIPDGGSELAEDTILASSTVLAFLATVMQKRLRDTQTARLESHQ